MSCPWPVNLNLERGQFTVIKNRRTIQRPFKVSILSVLLRDNVKSPTYQKIYIYINEIQNIPSSSCLSNSIKILKSTKENHAHILLNIYFV